MSLTQLNADSMCCMHRYHQGEGSCLYTCLTCSNMAVGYIGLCGHQILIVIDISFSEKPPLINSGGACAGLLLCPTHISYGLVGRVSSNGYIVE